MPPLACTILPRSSSVAAADAARATEQLVLHERFRQRAAVHRNEGLVRPLAGRVQRAREKFLAGARLAEQQYRNVARLEALGRLDVARQDRVAEIELIEHAASCLGHRALLGRLDALFAGGCPLRLRRLRDGEEAAAVAGLVDRQRMEGLLLAAADEGGQ